MLSSRVVLGSAIVFAAAAQTLFNGLTLSSPWPPKSEPTQLYRVPPYLTNPPSVIGIDVGRQLFVDDYLIESATLQRVPHRPVMWPFNPVLTPGGWDTTNMAMPYSDGVWFDPADRLFKMWYFGGYGNMVSYATSTDGRNWIKPNVDGAVSGTNMVLQLGGGRDSNTVWMDLQDPNPARKYKSFSYYPPDKIQVFFSPDGIHWTGPQTSYNIKTPSDRTTFFYNPFRNVWVESIRMKDTLPPGLTRPSYYTRVRYYAESPDLLTWNPSDFTSIFWTGPDENDPPYAGPGGAFPELYNLDAVAYESVMVGLFNWYHPGPAYDPSYAPGPNLVELGVGFSRDGFHWSRPTRGQAFIPATNIEGTWNGFNTQSAGGCFLVVGDELFFYFSGRDLNKPESGAGSTGLGMLRRDGFYSMDAGATEGVLTTRPVRFSGSRLFVNVDDPAGQLRAEVLDQNGNVIAPYTKANSIPLSTNKTLAEMRWTGASDLAALAGRNVKFRFYLTNGSLYAFWVSPNASGASNGFVAAGGPGFPGMTDTVGAAGMPAAASAPVIAPAGGTFPSPPQISMLTATVGAQIRYTMDGSEPTSASALYAGPFSLAMSGTVKAKAFAPGLQASGTATATFTILDYLPPTVQITRPIPGQPISGQFVLTATASDNVGVAGIQFTVDGANIGPELSSAPYTLSLDSLSFVPGLHTFRAVARDFSGNSAPSDPVSITVLPDVIPPIVKLTSPEDAQMNLAPRGTATQSGTTFNGWAALAIDGNTDGYFWRRSVTHAVGNPVPWWIVDLGAVYDLSRIAIWNRTECCWERLHNFHVSVLSASQSEVAGGDYYTGSNPYSPDQYFAINLPPKTTGRYVKLHLNTPEVLSLAEVQVFGGEVKSVSRVIGIAANASDNDAVAGLQFRVDGVSLGAEILAPPYSAVLDTAKLANGMHTITAAARDRTGNRAIASVVIHADNDLISPSVAITTPGAGETVTKSVTVTASATDNVGVAGLQFLLDGSNAGAELAAPPYTISIDTAKLMNGIHTFAAVARDAYGNTAKSPAVNVYVNNDLLPPTATLTAPAASQTVSRTITATATASDNVGVVGVQFLLDGSSVGPELTAPPYSVTLDTAKLTNGVHAIAVAARDAYGNRSVSATVNVTVDNDLAPPTVTLTAPAAGQTISKTVTVTATAADNVGVTGVQFLLDGSNVGSELAAPPYNMPLDTTRVTNGVHALAAAARDAYGNRTVSASVSITVANDAIAPVVSVTAPASGQTVSNTVLVTASASDNVSVEGVQFLLDGANLGAELTVVPYAVSVDTKKLANGTHTVAAAARDAAGNRTVSTNVVFTVSNDLAPPTIAFMTPGASQTVSGAIVVSVTASDNTGIAGVQLAVDGVNAGAEIVAVPYAMTLDTTRLANGPHTLSAVARDTAGNRATVTRTIFTLNDLTPPTVSIVSPAANQILAGTVTLNAAGGDDVGVIGLQFQVDGANLGAEITAPPFTAGLDTTRLSNGAHTIGAVARDAAGRLGSATITVQVHNAIAAVAPVALYTFDAADISGNVLLDRGTAGANATSYRTTPVAGVSGTAMHFSGSAYAAVSNSSLFNLNSDLTLSVWLRTANSTQSEGVLSKYDASGSEGGYLLRTTRAGTASLLLGAANAGARKEVLDTRRVNDGQWHHVAVVMSLSAGVTFYVDGSVGVSSPGALTAARNAAYFTIGCNPWLAYGSYFNGDLDQVRVYNVALTADQIAAVYKSEINETAKPPAVVSVTAPTGGEVVSGVIQAAASASGGSGIAHVQFRLDGADFGAPKTAPPYTITVDTATLSNGAHTISALARDTGGAQAESAVVGFTVLNDKLSPAVSITAPASAQVVSGQFTAMANATDDVGVAGVQFRLDGADAGAEKTAPPYSVVIDTTVLTNGVHTISAVARDAAGRSAASAAVTFTVANDKTPPTVSITGPTVGQIVSGQINAMAAATDDIGVAGVQFRLDGADLGAEKTTAPYTIAIDTTALTNGAHRLSAVARDAAAHRTESAAVSFSVLNDKTAPAVSITTPTVGQVISGQINAMATATDDVGVAGVQFRLDGAAFGTERTIAPYTIAIDSNVLANGPHTIGATARDAAGRRTDSAPVAFSVMNDNAAPAVSITNPASGATISGQITITAAATDDVGVVGLQFRINGANFGVERTAPPFSAALDTNTLPNGSHTISAVVRDLAGHRTESAPVTVTVTNAPPALLIPALAYWSFDATDPNASIIVDDSGNHFDLTSHRAAATPGKARTALRFNGNAYATLSSDARLNLASDMTFAFWIRTANASRLECVLSKYGAADLESGYLIRTTAAGMLGIRLGGSNLSSGLRDCVDVTRINDGNWHYAVVVIKLGAGVTFYIDGALSSQSQRGVLAARSPQIFQIGLNPWQPYGTYFNGDLDELRVFGRALTAAEVADLYRAIN